MLDPIVENLDLDFDIEDLEISTDIQPPATVSQCEVDLDKVIGYFKRHTKNATDAIEKILDQVEISHELQSELRKILHINREHLSGLRQDMVWLSQKEALHYVQIKNSEYTGESQYTMYINDEGNVAVKPPDYRTTRR